MYLTHGKILQENTVIERGIKLENQSPKLSIIIPVYQKENYINGLLSVIADQTFTDFECILVDDGSADASGDICDMFAAKDSRFVVIHKKNAGVSAARNTALDLAKGEYVIFIDADDRISKTYCEQLVRSIENTHADIVFGSLVKIWPDSNQKEIVSLPYSGMKQMDELLKNFAKIQYKTGVYGFCCGKIISRSLIDSTRFTPGLRLAEDLDFYLSVYPKVNTIYFDKDIQYGYLQEAQNSTGKEDAWEIDYFAQLKIQLKLYDFLIIKKGAYSNKSIVVQRIYDYVYFTLHYASLKDFKETYIKIKQLSLPRHESYNGDIIQKSAMLFFIHHMPGVMKLEFKAERLLRKLKK